MMIWPSGYAGRRKNGSAPLNFSVTSAMEMQRDFRELLALFNELGVEHLSVGAYALAFHGAPRFTGPIHFLGRAQEVLNKRTTGRKKD